MSSVSVDHLYAAMRHETAADGHDRAALFWDKHGDRERAGLQREMAEYERHGAELERRWAELTERSEREAGDRSEIVNRHRRDGAKNLSVILNQTADALTRSAELAQDHADRREQAGWPDDAAQELETAARTREAAERARAQAAEWLKISQRDGDNG